MNTQLVTAYAVCRGIARTRAKNFYYGFLPLPKEKRNALCAVYAFMRHADDISDDASRSVPERRLALSTWLAEWHSVSGGTPTTDPVFFALADAQRRFYRLLGVGAVGALEVGILAFLLRAEDALQLPFGAQANAWTAAVWPSNSPRALPVAVSQT